MQIKKLILRNYRNYDKLEINFKENLNIIIGNNAQGKTNIIESIYLLGITRSFLTTNDKNLIKLGSNNCKIKGNVVTDNCNKTLEIIITDDNKKVKINNKEVVKLSDYISKFNIVIFGPNDLKIIKDNPNLRRRFLDIEISQLNIKYLKKMSEFNVLLKNRNEYLKYIKINGNYNKDYLEIINNKYAQLCVDIYLMRNNFINRINENIGKIYENISIDSGLKLKYVSNVSSKIKDSNILEEEFLNKLNDNLSKEINYGSSILGIKRDDFSFYLGDKNLNMYGSQGQQKLAVLSLKLAELDIFYQEKKENPILLLDDLFSELDIKKRNKVIKYISSDIQTIITTTDLNKIDKKLVKDAKIFKVAYGRLEEE